MKEKIEMLIAEHKLHREEVLQEINYNSCEMSKSDADVLIEEYSMRSLFISQLEELL